MTSSYILVYTDNAGENLPTFVGVWYGNGKKRVGDESIGLLIRQGLAGFNASATWKDLTAQLAESGFRREDISVHEVMRVGEDIVRVVFWKSGQISCQWLTMGPDDNAAAAGKPIGILPPREGN
jgi:hypothetical protein